MDESNGNARLLALVDGAIAITITLLMLEIRLPVEAGELPDSELLRALIDIWPRYLAYVISFLVIASFWIGHRRKFQFIKASSGPLIFLNILFLLAVGLIPFASGLISDNPGEVATIFYAVVMILAAFALAGVWAYAVAAGLVDDSATRAVIRQQFVQTLGSAAVFAISIPVALLNADAAKYVWLLVLVLFIGRLRSGSKSTRQA